MSIRSVAIVIVVHSIMFTVSQNEYLLFGWWFIPNKNPHWYYAWNLLDVCVHCTLYIHYITISVSISFYRFLCLVFDYIVSSDFCLYLSLKYRQFCRHDVNKQKLNTTLWYCSLNPMYAFAMQIDQLCFWECPVTVHKQVKFDHLLL